jgi:hypothetical protein
LLTIENRCVAKRVWPAAVKRQQWWVATDAKAGLTDSAKARLGSSPTMTSGVLHNRIARNKQTAPGRRGRCPTLSMTSPFSPCSWWSVVGAVAKSGREKGGRIGGESSNRPQLRDRTPPYHPRLARCASKKKLAIRLAAMKLSTAAVEFNRGRTHAVWWWVKIEMASSSSRSSDGLMAEIAIR